MAIFQTCAKDFKCNKNNYCDKRVLKCQPCGFICGGQNPPLCTELCASDKKSRGRKGQDIPGIVPKAAVFVGSTTQFLQATTPRNDGGILSSSTPILIAATAVVLILVIVIVAVCLARCCYNKGKQSKGADAAENGTLLESVIQSGQHKLPHSRRDMNSTPGNDWSVRSDHNNGFTIQNTINIKDVNGDLEPRIQNYALSKADPKG